MPNSYPPQPPGGAWPPPPGRPSRLALDGATVREAVVAGASAVVSALVTALVIVTIVTAVASSASDGASGAGPFPVWNLAAWVAGLAFGVPLVVQAAGSASSFASGSLGASVHIPVPLVLTVACVLAAVLTVRSQRRRPVGEPVTALAASGCAAIVPFVLGLIVSFASTASAAATTLLPVSGGGGIGIGLAHFRAGFYPALIVFAVTLGARVSAGGLRTPAALQSLHLGAALRAIGEYLLITATLTSLVLLVVGLAELPSARAAFGIWALTLPGLGVLGTELATFAPLQVTGWSAGGLTGSASSLGSGSAAGSTSFSLVSGYVSAWWFLLVLIPLTGIAMSGVRYTLRRPPSARAPWAGAATVAAMLIVALLVLNLYLGVSGSASGQASTSAFGGGAGSAAVGAGVGVLGYLSAAVVGALIPLAGWVVTPLLYRTAPNAGAPAPLPPPGVPPTAAAAEPFAEPSTYGPPPVAPVGAAPEPSASAPASGPAWPPPDAHIPPAPPQWPGGRSVHPRPGGGARSPVLIGAVVGAVVLAAVLGLLIGRVIGSSTSVAGPATTFAAPPTASTTVSSRTPTDTATSAPTFATQSPGGIDLYAVAAEPVAPRVADTLDTYFGGINAHDGAQAASAFDPSGTVDPTDPAQVAQFQQDISTSTDDQVVIHSIQPDPAPAGGYLVALSFRSQQDPAFGPGGSEGCTNWSLTYRLTAQVKLLGSQGATHVPC